MQNRHVVVIGAGASGLMAAVTAAGCGCRVTVLEHTSKIGRKIEITGNGRCNYTNARQGMEFYHSQTPEYAQRILEQFTQEQTIAFFEKLGITPKCRNGYYYPHSGQAQAVSAALRMEAERLHVKLACNIAIKEIKREEHMFYIETEGYTYTADAVILAAGSKAAAVTGSDGSGYRLARQLGHEVIEPLPALVQLLSRDKTIPLLAGLRTEAGVELLIDGRTAGREQGEVQFVKNGLSGIPVFQLSGRAARALWQGKRVELVVDFLAGCGWTDKGEALKERREILGNRTLSGFLNGLVHEKVQKALAVYTGMKGNVSVQDMDEALWNRLEGALCGMRYPVYDTNGFEHAQVCSGGVSLKQLREGTLESAQMEGLYFAGEILDVDGVCGGYNLQWAWASGYVAGSRAAGG